MAFFSVIIPVYNDAQYLHETIQSALDQTFGDFEIVVVDDGSTDRTREIAQKSAEQDKRVRPIFLAENRGTHFARKTGALAASGDYVVFLDGDDAFVPDALEKLHTALKDKPSDILQFRNEVVNDSDLPEEAVLALAAFIEPDASDIESDELVALCVCEGRFSWNIWGRAFRANLVKTAFSSMSDDRLVIFDDLYETFLLLHFAGNRNFLNDTPLYRYHYGRGFTGRAKISADAFRARNADPNTVLIRLRAFAEETGSTKKYEAVFEKMRQLFIGGAASFWMGFDAEEKLRTAPILAYYWDQEELLNMIADRFEPEQAKAAARILKDVTLEQQMLEIAKAYPENASADHIANDSRYEVNNVFSPVRHNILNWYPFRADADILEVGAGMGALTGLLCDAAKTVCALEPDPACADIIRARFPSRGNLAIRSESPASWGTEQRFDYIVVVGGFAGDGSFGHQDTGLNAGDPENPYADYLSALKNLLKPDGILLFAIENRFGLKYWLGAAEDRLKEPFVGLTGYRDAETPKTFTKAELEALFSAAGLENRRFYYPLPDYRFPTNVFSEEALPSVHDLLNIRYTYAKGSMLVANEKDLYKDILENGLFEKFADAFFVEASAGKLPEDHVTRVSVRGEARPEYRIITTIDSLDTVVKRPGEARAKNHVRAIFDTGESLRKHGVKHIPGTFADGGYVTKIYPAPMANSIFEQALAVGDMVLAKKMIDCLQTALERSSTLTEEINPSFGLCDSAGMDPGPVAKDGYLDMTLYNAFWKDGDLVFFDQEWAFPGLPLRFILYYGLKITYSRASVKPLLPFDDILAYIGVGTRESAVWDALEPRLWAKVVARSSDPYGADREYNEYSDWLTLAEQQRREGELLRSKEGQVQSLTYDFEKAKGQIQGLQTMVAERDAFIDEKDEGLRSRDAEIHAVHSTLAGVYESYSWKIGRRLGKVVRVLLPEGSGRTRMAVGAFRRFKKTYRKMRGIPDAAGPESAIASKLTPPKEQKRLAFSPVDSPLVSVVIPVHNQFDYTYTCLKSILDTCGGIPYEIIIGDDASTDRTQKIVKYAAGVKIVRNEPPLLFLRNCNHAARHGKGEFLVFLNNDTIVHEGWLSSLLSLIQSDSSIGIVGSKLLFADGSLQEAGGIIWNDGSGWNYGRGGDPDAAEHNYLKEVDYVSGCSLMIRKSLWDELGGFDERFAPAYYEDTDLAFQARRRGFKAMYQPLSVVTHFEGVSHGTDTETGLKAYQAKNQRVFFEKWQSTLESEQSAPSDFFSARDRSQRKKTLVMVDHYVPTFDKDAGSRSIFEYLKLFLGMGYHVVFIPDNYHRTEHYADVLTQMGIEVLYGDWYFLNWKEWIIENKDRLDVFFLSRPHISIKYIDHIRANTDATILYCGQDLHFLREQRQYEVTHDPKLLVSIEEWRETELELIRKSDCALYPSFEEENYIKSIEDGARVETYPVYIIPDLVRSEYRIEEREDLLFVGGFGHPPNGDAMIWFLNEIFPAIQRERPEIRLNIVGSNPPDDVREQASENVVIHGFVSDEELDRLYAGARLVVVPLRYGAGIKGKVVESMAKGVPLVTTSIGAEGFYDAENYLAIKDDAEAFARRVLAMYDDKDALTEMAEAAYEYLAEHYSEKKAREVLLRALGHVGKR